ncbi:MAG TPA: DUF2167 domain-containing protein [Enterobacteriaceae bacterium]|nr:DUF2167 domain-containing protein [Enterobacteriaceae bacterium]
MKKLFGFTRYLSLLLAALITFSTAVRAETPTAEELQMERAMDAMRKASVTGPEKVKLGNQATIDLPADYTWVPPKEAGQFMRLIGNSVDSSFHGLIFHDNISGFVSIEYIDSGYIKDDDAKDWDADELLDNLQEGTKEGNKSRAEQGIAPIEVLGWVEKPHYLQPTHRLVWSAAIRDIGSNVPQAEQGVNYNTYQLGREGYLSLNLVTDRGTVESEKPLANQLLSAVHFNDGKSYGDFNASTDKVAEYGLAALIGGIAAKKLGLLALIGVTLLKFWKLGVIGIAAVGMGAKKLLARKKSHPDLDA